MISPRIRELTKSILFLALFIALSESAAAQSVDANQLAGKWAYEAQINTWVYELQPTSNSSFVLNFLYFIDFTQNGFKFKSYVNPHAGVLGMENRGVIDTFDMRINGTTLSGHHFFESDWLRSVGINRQIAFQNDARGFVSSDLRTIVVTAKYESWDASGYRRSYEEWDRRLVPYVGP